MSLKRTLSQFRAPEEAAAEDRAWTVVRSVARDSTPAPRRWPLRLLAIAPVLVGAVAVLALSPAGAAVRRWISHELGVRHAAPALFALPAPGRLLVSGVGGAWIVSADGSARRLGAWPQASWSPHGWFVAVASGNELLAVDPQGTPRWRLARPAVSDPRWYPPTGYRIAYLSGSELRVVVGNGTGDHLLATGAASVAPAWRPDHPYELAYVTRLGTLVVRDADTGAVAWTTRVPGAQALSWSADGRRLLVMTRARALLYDGSGRLSARLGAPPHAPLIAGSLSPDGRTLALVRGGEASDLVLASLGSSRRQFRRVLSLSGLRALAWSPDGRWLLVSLPAADQWVFVRIAGNPRIAAVSRIAGQFATAAAPRGFPRLDGWCCTTAGAAG